MSVATLRMIATQEASIIQDLAHRTWPTTFNKILSPEQISYMLNWMYDVDILQQQISEGHQFWLIEKEFPLGFMGIELHHPSAYSLKIHKLYVLPEEQGQGWGRMLVNKAIEIAQTNSIPSIELNVNRFNASVGFYKHIGFEVVKEENIDIGAGFWMEDFVMELRVV
jgi:ribosomal protein S18 acetylase RimI-like enzyme